MYLCCWWGYHEVVLSPNKISLLFECGLLCKQFYPSRERWDIGKCWEISPTLKQPQNHSLFILPPVNVKYYCLFHSDTLLPNPQGAFRLTAVPFTVLLNGSLVRLRCHVLKDTLSRQLYLFCHTHKEWRVEISAVHVKPGDSLHSPVTVIKYFCQGQPYRQV